MKHPIYKDSEIDLVLFIIEKNIVKFSGKNSLDEVNVSINDDFLAKMGIPDKEVLKGFSYKCYIINRIINAGHVLIISDDDWESDISKKVISEMTLKDFKFPFNSGGIKLNNDFIGFAVCDDALLMYHNDGGGVWGYSLSFNIKVKERVLDWTPNNIRIIYKALSALLYISAFKNDAERVSKPKVIKVKKSVEIPKHYIHCINLKQKKLRYKNNGTGVSWHSNKSWVVRGHWRKYPEYYKWIDMYFKGVGKENIQKIYKI